MKKLIFMAVIALTSVTTFAADNGSAVSRGQAPTKKVSCEGFVSFENGTLDGRTMVTVREQRDGTWIVNDHIDAGRNLSNDPALLQLDSYGSFLNCSGATVDYDSRTKQMTFRYKYDSGDLGGGCMKTAATFGSCQEN